MPTVKKYSSNTEQVFKKPVERSVAYPAFTIDYSVELTRAIYANFGLSGYNTREVIGKVLKKSPDYLKSPISSCVQYGLLDMKSKLGYKPSPLFMQIYKQDDPDKLRAALLTCLKEPKVYSTLLSKYTNDVVPPITALANYLFRNENIAEKATEKAASVFLENLKSLELISGDNKLSDEKDLLPDSVDNNNTGVSESIKMDDVRNMTDIAKKDDLVGKEIFTVEVPLNDGRKAKVLCPIDINDRDWRKIIKVLNSYIDEE